MVREVLHRVDASHERRGQLSEGREHEVVDPERHRAADLRGFLAFESGVDGQLALALQGDALSVEPPREHHVPEHRPQLVGLETHVGVAHRGAVRGQHAHRPGAAPVLRFGRHADPPRALPIGRREHRGECSIAAGCGRHRGRWRPT